MREPYPDESSAQPALSRTMQWLLAGVLFAGVVAYVVISWPWPLIWDMQVMHYVSFLIDRGWAPYRQIHDMNLPGSYLVEGWALAVFGASDLGWRLYDFTLGVVLTGSMMAIARRYDWRAGLLAGITFTLAHAAEGPRNAGQRDQVIAVLLMLGTALLLESVRRQRAWLLFFFAFAVALAASLKPFVAPFGLIVLGMSAWQLRRNGQRLAAYLLFSLAGYVAVAGLLFGFLLRHQALQSFVTMLVHVLPHYVGLLAPTWGDMVLQSIQLWLAVFVFLAVLAAIGGRQIRPNWEQTSLLIGVLFGAFSYFVQRKGFEQHRYTMLTFLLLWASIQTSLALRLSGQPRLLAKAALVVVVLLYVPWNIWWMTRWPQHDAYRQALMEDLRGMDVSGLQHQVQCLDIVDGCMNALFQLKIEQSNGSTGDLLLFLPAEAPAVTEARALFWKEVQQNPPKVFVLSNDGFGEFYNFDILKTWPLFEQYLATSYSLRTQREFYPRRTQTSNPGSNPPWPAYRIYVRNRSAEADGAGEPKQP